jgi:spore maturation protein CgeB
VLANSKATLNCHIDVAGDHADNMRLFEATGMGTLLITDWKRNLHAMFDLEKEVATYRGPEECWEKVAYYLCHPEEREAVARAGRERTLRQHTYHHRMQELLDILRKYL